MFINELLAESLSRVAFHYTNIPTALKIVQGGNFELSSAYGSIEQQYMPRGKPYFLSTTRTRRGGYHDNAGRTTGVLFVLDGNWFNQHYVSRPLDYWENRDPTRSHHRTHEAEDRVFSAEPSIPIGGVSAIHVLFSIDPDWADDKTDAHNRAVTRELLIAAKTQGIPAYFYTDKAAWQNQDIRRLGNVKVLTGARDKAWHRPRRRRSYMQSWIELMSINDPSKLSKDADKMRYNLSYTYDRDEATRVLDVDMSNARKPDSGQERSNAVKIIAYMRQHRLNTIADFVNHIADKWKTLNQKTL
jgi:hypothetical protein